MPNVIIVYVVTHEFYFPRIWQEKAVRILMKYFLCAEMIAIHVDILVSCRVTELLHDSQRVHNWSDRRDC